MPIGELEAVAWIDAGSRWLVRTIRIPDEFETQLHVTQAAGADHRIRGFDVGSGARQSQII